MMKIGTEKAEKKKYNRRHLSGFFECPPRHVMRNGPALSLGKVADT
jgi:hypothetical protein